MSSSAGIPSGVTLGAEGAQAPLTDQEMELVRRMFSDPFAIPLEFKAWMIAFLEANPPRFGISAIDGFNKAVTARIEAVPPETAVAYVQSTAGAVVTNVASTILSVTADCPGTPLELEFWCAGYNTNQTAELMTIVLNVIGDSSGVAQFPLTNNAFPFAPMIVKQRVTPSKGTHTFTVQGVATGAFSNVNLFAGSGFGGNYMPMYFRALATP